MEILDDNEFYAYFLLFASSADFKLSKDESEYILSKVDSATYAKAIREFQSDNDIQRIKKIQDKLNQSNQTTESLDFLINEMLIVFNLDGKYSNLEKNLMLGFKRLLKP